MSETKSGSVSNRFLKVIASLTLAGASSGFAVRAQAADPALAQPAKTSQNSKSADPFAIVAGFVAPAQAPVGTSNWNATEFMLRYQLRDLAALNQSISAKDIQGAAGKTDLASLTILAHAQMIRYASEMESDLAKLKAVTDYNSETTKYDDAGSKIPEEKKRAHPEITTLLTRKGRCTDYAIVNEMSLHEAGIDKSRTALMHIIATRRDRTEVGHAVVIANVNNTNYVVDFGMQPTVETADRYFGIRNYDYRFKNPAESWVKMTPVAAYGADRKDVRVYEEKRRYPVAPSVPGDIVDANGFSRHDIDLYNKILDVADTLVAARLLPPHPKAKASPNFLIPPPPKPDDNASTGPARTAPINKMGNGMGH